MPKRAAELSAYQVKPFRNRPGFHSVGGVAGLHLRVSKALTASWILRVKMGERRRDIGLGPYPEISLANARERAREAKDEIRQGKDPIAIKRERRDALTRAQQIAKVEAARKLTFDEASLQCWRAKSAEFKNAKHAAQWRSTLETYASPVIGDMAVGDIETADVHRVLAPIWGTKTETASRLRGRIETVLSWAAVGGYRSGENPARWRGNLEHMLPRASKLKRSQHHRAVPWQQVGATMAELKQRQGIAATALELLILTAARSGEVRNATWDEIDIEAQLWTVPAERMKAGRAHRIHLSEPALALLRAAPRFEGSPYVFPSPRGGALSDMTLTAVLRRMKVDATVHGFRSTFKDWSRSCTAYPDEVSELALAHVSSDATRAAYARDALLPQRARLLDDWASFCSTQCVIAGVSPIRGGMDA